MDLTVPVVRVHHPVSHHPITSFPHTPVPIPVRRGGGKSKKKSMCGDRDHNGLLVVQ